MPIHDWTRAEAGDFHHFHQTVDSAPGRCPERRWFASGVHGPGRASHRPPDPRCGDAPVCDRPSADAGGVAIAPAPAPSARVIQKFERINYAKRADRVVIRHGRGRVVAIIEIVSPGNKDSRHAIRSFVEKAADILSQGIHLVVVDLFPPTPRDPQGIHKAIWDEFSDEPFDFLPDKPLTVASYIGGDLPTAYVESVGVGDRLPAIPLFLTEYDYVPCPLDATYEQAWAVFPAMLKEILESPG